MKFLSVVALSFAALLSPATATYSSNSDGGQVVTNVQSCYWSGSAPFCAGGCGFDAKECATSACGDGACCVTGYKKLCCYGNTCQY
ncbi:hypothetical protein DEU56DRAFT_744386 [Suillus clintonianus]|uniref:uncharacterized protein n=1 Tax=Suillus clintonianus TaxID=1904413 RepID=UPI001B88501B|nr:uncharacterized protein DEU56DRAFT_744386 [Suillus clintonianus]KAG2124687.1 hypothetical protein DEU56DRAFT_744386 [Suillus clintonianus]